MTDYGATDLIAHIEHALGPMAGGWKSSVDADQHISVTSYASQPFPGYTTFVTLGLSNHVLARNGKEVRQELVLAVQDLLPREQAMSVLMTFAQHMSSRHMAVMRGEVIGPYAEPLVPETEMIALYATCPVVFDEALACFEGSDPPTVFVWLIPINAKETEFISQKGWSTFERLLEEKNPDLLDLRRESVV